MNKQEYLDKVAALTREYEKTNIDKNGHPPTIVGILIDFTNDDELYEWDGGEFAIEREFKMQKVLKK